METNNKPAEPESSIFNKTIIVLVAILVTTLALFLLAVVLQGNLQSILLNPLAWFSQLDQDTAFENATNSAELLAAVLAIAITVIAIVVELAANRYSHRITSLFVREPINIVVMCFFVVATVFSVWIALTLHADVENPLVLHAGLLFNLFMVTVSLIVLLPYFGFVLSFLSPVNVIGKIQKSALDAIEKVDQSTVSQSQLKFLNAVDELQDIARRSSELSDRAVEMASINAMQDLIIDYQGMVSELEEKAGFWFEIGEFVSKDPDFVSIDKGSLQQIVEQKMWVEVKILRQYLDLISDSNPSTRDTSYLIAINTKKIAIVSLTSRPELELMELCIRCFNSYLRATINNRDARTGYYIMNQYRKLAEEAARANHPEVVKEIALHLQFYGLLGFKQGIPFLLEVVAEDIAELAKENLGKNDQLLDDLLSLLLDLDQEVKSEFQEDSLLGVRRAQLKLAAVLTEHGENDRALRICEDLRTEKPAMRAQLLSLLTTDDRQEYWEFTDRGVNFAYLDPRYRQHLNQLAVLFNK